jgi:hypothetical protein
MITDAVKTRLTKVYHTSKSNAEKKQLQFNIDKDYLEILYIGCQGRCPFTGVELDPETGTVSVRNPLGISLDRIDSEKGYIKGNVRIVSTWYNNAKQAWSDDFMFEMAKKLTSRIS